MMGSCALLMPAASVRFVREGAYDPRAALGLTLAGIPGVLVAAFIVRSLRSVCCAGSWSASWSTPP